ncbi:hypothetical protein PA25_22070 [Pseudoalteromonas sp. A25]|uniref:helix-turn-helix domain-containing protein n=1 Tax=Pseudoalteromonas sp. A25 TaxID=116092 RepID=UPI00126125C2|nr:helix-turn-helix domain-containing protein [Pseudoalteromonas sp. A25]BBN82222.1 hypothetical protein PA25_22070 [Pseudoalteromonas sp. A25]
MKISANRVVELRKSRSWSQSELARLAGLNLRTVQRIEREGVASTKSKNALADVFGLSSSDLDKTSPTNQYEFKVLEIAFDSNISLELNSPLALELNTQLNKHGQAGWKLAQVIAPESIAGGFSVPSKKLLAIMQRAINK